MKQAPQSKVYPLNPSQTPFKLQRPSTALGLLACFFLFFLVIAGVLLPFVNRLVSRPEAAVRIAAVIQDLLIFILPAIGTAMIVTRLPAKLLAIDIKPRISSLLLSLLVLICAIPAMNWIIEWNQGWHLPESMSGAEAFFRQLEEGATATTDLLIRGASVPSLIVSVLIVGVLAGFSEELFFRGAFQRIFAMTKVNHHVVIWTVAIIFSAFHFQLFGFVPRMLLGAFFGYLLYWSGTLWLPVILHIFNNSVVVIAEYYNANMAPSATESASVIDSIGANPDSAGEISVVILSVILTIAGIYTLYRNLNGPYNDGTLSSSVSGK